MEKLRYSLGILVVEVAGFQDEVTNKKRENFRGVSPFFSGRNTMVPGVQGLDGAREPVQLNIEPPHVRGMQSVRLHLSGLLSLQIVIHRRYQIIIIIKLTRYDHYYTR